MAWEGDTIRWVGPRAALPAAYASAEVLDAGGGLVIPGLVDCHTHLAFGGWRAGGFVERIEGRSYLDIARAGGGIARTVRLTREAGDDELLERAQGFLEAMLRLGVTTVECKSGYGLDREHELRLLRIYRRLAERDPIRLVPTFLGAHVVPPEFRGDRAGYLALLEAMLPELAREGLARFCDVFVEQSAFSPDEARRLLRAAQRHGLGAKLHADQLSAGGGAELAAEVGAVSADHLECASAAGVEAMARAGVVAVSLPIASLYLGQAPFAARRWIAAGVAGAVGTDFKPRPPPCHRPQPGRGPELPPTVRAHPRLHPSAHDAGGSAQGRDDVRGTRRGAGRPDRLARAGQGGGLRRTRRPRRSPLAVPPPAQRLPAHRGRRRGTLASVSDVSVHFAELARSPCPSSCWAPSAGPDTPSTTRRRHGISPVGLLSVVRRPDGLACAGAGAQPDRTSDESADRCSRRGGHHLGGPEQHLRPHRVRRALLDHHSRGRPGPLHSGHRVQAPERHRPNGEPAGER